MVVTPVNFPESNCVFGPPSDLDESQVMRIHGYKGQVKGGSCDGCEMVIVAWKPTQVELDELNAGGCIYLECLGGLPPHLLATNFKQASNPA